MSNRRKDRNRNSQKNQRTVKCTCGNPSFGFNCVCKWVLDHPGSRQFSCQWCGFYAASRARCTNCKEG